METETIQLLKRYKDMKRLIYALIILMFISIICLTGSILICQYCEKSREELRFCANLSEEQNWNEAQIQTENLKSDFEKREPVMAFFVDHKLLDNINELMSTLPVYAKKEEDIKFEAVCAEIGVILDRISGMQSIKIENFY